MTFEWCDYPAVSGVLAAAAVLATAAFLVVRQRRRKLLLPPAGQTLGSFLSPTDARALGVDEALPLKLELDQHGQPILLGRGNCGKARLLKISLCFKSTSMTLSNPEVILGGLRKSQLFWQLKAMQVNVNCRGHMQVYKARWSGAIVAVKVLTSELQECQEDFKWEAALLAKLRHPNIVSFLGVAMSADEQVSWS